MAKSFVNILKNIAPALWFVKGDVLPHRGCLAVDPPVQPLPGESKTLILVLLTSAQQSTQDTFDLHVLFPPRGDVVVVGGAGQHSAQALGPL